MPKETNQDETDRVLGHGETSLSTIINIINTSNDPELIIELKKLMQTSTGMSNLMIEALNATTDTANRITEEKIAKMLQKASDNSIKDNRNSRKQFITCATVVGIPVLSTTCLLGSTLLSNKDVIDTFVETWSPVAGTAAGILAIGVVAAFVISRFPSSDNNS